MTAADERMERRVAALTRIAVLLATFLQGILKFAPDEPDATEGSSNGEKPEVFTVADLAIAFDVSPQTIYKMIYDETIPVPPVKVGTQWRFSRRQVDDYLARRHPAE